MSHSAMSKIVLSAMLFAGLALFAQATNADIWRAKEVNGGRGFTVGTYAVDNPAYSRSNPQYPFSGKNRTQVWRHFMHGIIDSEATPIAWNALATPEVLKRYMDVSALINTPVKRSTLPAIRLEGKKSLELPVPVFDTKTLSELKGENLRFFIWIKGENTGQGSNLWDAAPGIQFALYDKDGDLFEKYTPIFKTRGTFPWFCYYMDVKIPATIPLTATTSAKKEEEQDAFQEFALSFLENGENGEKHPTGLYVKLYNPASGTAWFSTLSYQIIREEQTLLATRNKTRLYDPVTGSLAPNPDYDELPMHIVYGLSDRLKWNFLSGTKTLTDITRKAQLDKYITTYYNDWAHTIFAMANLPYIKANADILKNSAEFEQGWDDTLLEFFAGAQEINESRLWSIGDVPNLFLTSRIVSQAFTPVQPARADRPKAEETPWFSIKGNKLKYADTLINSIVDAQRTHEKNGQKAGWNSYAFQEEMENIPDQKSPCDFPATVAAVSILHRAIPLASPKAAERGRTSVRQAWEYVMKNMLNRDYTWKNTALRTKSVPSYEFFQFIENTPYLEFRTGKKLKELKMKPSFDNGKVTFTWKKTQPYVSLRIFVVPAGTKPESLNETMLTAIVQPQTYDVMGMDPLLAMRRIATAAKEAWGIYAYDCDAPYVLSKLNGIPAKLRVIAKDGAISVPYSTTQEAPMAVFVAAVTPYGEMTPYLRFEKELPKPEPKPEANQTNEAEAAPAQ